MNLLKFITLFKTVKSLFSYLPNELQEELVDVMRDYYVLCIIARSEKMKGNR